MRATLVFLLCAIPATALLAYLDRDDRASAELPEGGPPADAPVLLAGTDLSDAYGQAPFSGSVRRLDGFELRVVEDGYFKLYLHVERLGRAGDRPRLEEVRAAVFDPPKDGRPNLRMTLRAPLVGGDPRELLNAPADAPRIVVLDGGVEVFDAAGRPLAEVPRLTLDVGSKTASADAPVLFRLPERAEVRAAGLDADLELRKARLKGPVVATVSGPGGAITLRAKGGATVDEAADGTEVRISLEGDAEVEHDAGRATCQRIDAAFARADGKTTFLRATLSGGVRIELAPGSAHGIETIVMPSLAIVGEDEISCSGPVRVAWRGRIPALALGDRTATFDAASASLRLGRAEDGRLGLDEARFEGFRAEDVDGAGSLSGDRATYRREGSVFAVDGRVEAKTPEAHLVALRLQVDAPGNGAYDVLVEGPGKRLIYRTEAGLGPFGGHREIRLEAVGPLRLRTRGDRISCSGENGVTATTDLGARLSGDSVALELEKGKLLSFSAKGHVSAVEPARGATVTGDLLSYEDGTTRIEGTKALVALEDGRTVRAPAITYREDRTFDAAGGVEAEAPLSADAAAAWRLSCHDAHGSLDAGGKPAAIEARGTVRALGPGGEEATGDSLAYDGTKGVATLLGAPARIRRGDELSLVAPKGLTLRIEDGRVAEGRSLGAATIDYRPVVPEGGKKAGFSRWVAELNGPARFEGDRVVVASGARLRGLDDGGAEALLAVARRVEILLAVSGKAVTVREVAGSHGVRVEGKGRQPAVVTADRLSYAAGSQEVHVTGGARVVAEGWPREVRFRELLFALTKEGIDLRRAAEAEVR